MRTKLSVEQATLNERLGMEIARLRTERKITQTKLAAAIGISSNQLYMYETGQNRIPAVMLIQIAARMNLSESAIFRNVHNCR
jgi:transcriptional regulator with XRE-family HTH domain